MPKVGETDANGIPTQPFECTVEILKISQTPVDDPRQLDYDTALFHAAVQAIDGPLAGQELGIRYTALNRFLKRKHPGKWHESRDIHAVGKTMKLRLLTWSGVNPQLRQAEVFDDTDQDLLVPIFIVQSGAIINKPCHDADPIPSYVHTKQHSFRQRIIMTNIVLFLIDDLGWMDLGCYGSTFYETPNIDRLAAQGMRFTNAYASCPVCSPTRASIMSGKYPARVGMTNWIGAKDQGRLASVPYLHYLPHSETSVASALREAGYATWHVGKWHLGDDAFYPEQHGFDMNYGGCHWGRPQKGFSRRGVSKTLMIPIYLKAPT